MNLCKKSIQAAAANSSEPAKPPIIYTEVKHDPVLQQKPEVKPRTKKPESAEAALARLRLEAASELPNAETEELAAVERRNKAILFASGIEPPSTKNPRELDAAVRQLTEQQTLQVLDKLRKAETVDLCFLVDVTFSMDPYISAVAKSVFQIVEEVARVHRGRPLIGKKQSFRVAFVGYRDIDPTIMREEPTEIIDFTSNVQLFRDKVNEIKVRIFTEIELKVVYTLEF